jgi:hypothetical protein
MRSELYALRPTLKKSTPGLPRTFLSLIGTFAIKFKRIEKIIIVGIV